MSANDLSDLSMLELFRAETDSQVQVLTTGLLTLEREPSRSDCLESCMRAAHSLKGAARIVGVAAGVSIAHAMEDCFVAAQRGALRLAQRHIDELLRGVDLLRRIAQTPETDLPRWDAEFALQVNAFTAALGHVMENGDELPAADQDDLLAAADTADIAQRPKTTLAQETHDFHLRVTPQDLNRLLGLASESLVESRWVQPFAQSFLRMKRLHGELSRALDQVREGSERGASVETALATARLKTAECQQLLSQRLEELDAFDRRGTTLAQRMYDAALACRMRPFADGVRGLMRLVRDVARSLGKQARLVIVGEGTSVDRDILAKLEAPLAHLLRNAVDHGIEFPAERSAVGKPNEGVVRLEARHAAGRLHVIVSDDGRGVDLEKLRDAIVARKLTDTATAAQLSEAELLEFLFLPGFTMADTVTEISGRGVGLDVVQDMIRQVRGSIRVTSQPGQGMRFELQCPLTLSVTRVLLVEIGAEPYAIPLTQIVRTLELPKAMIESLEGRPHFDLDGERVGLVTAHQIFGRTQPSSEQDELPVVVLGNAKHRYGLVIDRLLTERQVVVQPLDPRLGKVKDIAAGAVMEDGSPLLILDVEDVVRSVEKLIATDHLDQLDRTTSTRVATARKRVLVVDDSLTVRELERKLLTHQGYEVEVSVDGMDGWNAVRTGRFDLVITDIDMPRLDGIELVTLMKKDPHLKSLPVMIVSYKDRAEDRQRGLDAGADYYLAKGGFHDQTLLQAVVDLVGKADA